MAEYYDTTTKTERFFDFLFEVNWRLVVFPIYSWYVWSIGEMQLETASLKRQNKSLEWRMQVGQNDFDAY